jgi:hypothetical protein
MIAKTVAVQNKLGDGIRDVGRKDVNGSMYSMFWSSYKTRHMPGDPMV